MSSWPPQSSSESSLTAGQAPVPPTSGEQESSQQSDSNDLLTLLRRALAAGNQPCDQILRATANAARVLTGADGSAIGLQAENGVICRARSGDIAPELGAELSVDSGISGACFRSAEIMRCDDALRDARVDPEVCRMLGIRSIAAVPLRGRTGTIGIMEVFSSRAYTFSGEQIALLNEFAEIAEIAYQREQLVKNSTPAQSPIPPAAPAVSRVEGTAVATGVSAVDVSTNRAEKNIHRENGGEETSERKIAPVLLGPVAQKNKLLYWSLSAAAVLLLMAFPIIWWTWREPVGESATTQPVVQAHNPAEESPSATASPLVPAKPSPGIGNTGKSPAKSPLQNAANIEVISAPEATSTPTEAVENTSLASSSEAISEPIAAAPSAVEPPPVAVANSAENSDKLASLVSTSAPLPKLETRISQGVTQAGLLHKVDPIYPREAMSMRMAGSVTLSASIAENGTVSKIKVLRGPPILAEAATTAVRQWRYGQSLLNGKPVPVEKEITIIFKLP